MRRDKLASPRNRDQVIPEGALVVKAALLEEEHDFGAVEVLDLIATARHCQGGVKAGGAAEGKP